VAVAARREAVRQLQERGLSQRQALRLVGMSASTLRYQPRDDGNGRLRERLTELAGQHRRHGYRMLHSRLRIDGWAINVKRTYRVYREEGLMVRKRRRKKLPVPERQPLVRPMQPNEVWSMDFVFDELANGRRVKTLTVVDDCSKEAVQIAVDTSIPALYVTRLLDQVKVERGLPKVIRTDNGPEFAGRTMQNWAARNGVELRFIQPGKPVQNAYIESFNSRFRDECLSQHWFASLSHMRSVIDNWREDYNERRPHSTLGYVPPAAFAARCRQHAGATRQTPHQQLRCNPLGPRSKCYETWGQRIDAKKLFSPVLLPACATRSSMGKCPALAWLSNDAAAKPLAGHQAGAAHPATSDQSEQGPAAAIHLGL
jgi:putative transposase